MCNTRLPAKTTMKFGDADANAKPAPRPYTTYNIFFQLEREYILQHDLNVMPDLCPDEVFDPSSASYDGPALPQKYRHLTLRADWHRPGKAQRGKKRQHRASHGAIGFCALSKRISAAWRASDRDVKMFCARLSDMGMMRYRKEAQKLKSVAALATENKRSKRKKSKSKVSAKQRVFSTTDEPTKSSVAAATSSSAHCPSVSPEIDASLLNFPPLDFASLPAEMSSFLGDISAELAVPLHVNDVSHSSALPEHNVLAPLAPVVSGVSFDDMLCHPVLDNAPSCRLETVPKDNSGGMVDMLDDEIINIWRRD